MTVLVDSSVWIEFLRGTGGPADRWMLAAMRGNERLAWTEPILFELLAGVVTPRRSIELRALLMRGPVLRTRGLMDWEYAASLARLARADGWTIRSRIDCLIAAIAIRADVPLATVDRDFSVIADLAPLRLVPITP